MTREKGIQPWIYNEVATVDKISFRFKQKKDPRDYVVELANSMHVYLKLNNTNFFNTISKYYSDKHILSGPYLAQEFDEKLISEFISYLNPFNLL